MRIDIVTGYVLTGVFMVAMLIVGAQLLFGTGASIDGEEGLATLADPLEERFGAFVRWLFLIGFWAVATGAMLGTWNGAAHLFADYARIFRGVPDREELSERSTWFRAFLVWITFPPMVLLALDQGVYLVIVYASLGAVFFPFLAATLLYLLNSRRVVPEYRNRLLTNVVLAVAILLFVAVGAQELLGALGGG
jgi:Mn2+/Fe2+ NRAMP family transporter